MKIKQALEESIKKLHNNKIEDSGIIARELLSYVTNKNKIYLVINENKELESQEYSQYCTNIQKIIDGIPLQYITHKQEFMGLDFYVDENVLIPQPDTETLVENTLEICNKIISIQNNKIRILDLCTGSGAIAISLENKLQHKSEIYASDISIKALKIAEKNSNTNNSQINFIHSDLFERINQNDFEIIVSNPPYIKTETIKTLSKQVQNEPILALDGGKDGLDIYRKIIMQAYKHIKNNGYLCLEIGYDQREKVLEILAQYKNYTEIKTIKDLSKNDRCIIAKIKK